MYDRNRLAPVALTVERPVLHFVLNALFAASLFRKDFKHFFDSFLFVGNAVEYAGVYHFAVARIGLLGNISALNDLDNANAELLCKVVVTAVMGGNSHYCACAVAHHNVV